MKNLLNFIVCALIAAQLFSCTPAKMHDALNVVHQADTLQAIGADCNDSLHIARAAETLSTVPFRQIYADDYAHACYHYGRVLRKHDNPAEAMRWFLKITHSRRVNPVILGKAYANIAGMCHLAEEHELSRRMHCRSSECFAHSADTMLYYYSLYCMAYESAELTDSVEVARLTDIICQECNHPDIMPYVNLAKAQLYLKTGDYDNAVRYAKNIADNETFAHTRDLLLAQAYCFYAQTDSALYYARLVLGNPSASSNERFNALYIISHGNENITNAELIEATSLREDIRFYEMEPEREKLAVAVQLLRDDLAEKSSGRGIAVVICLILLVSGVVVIVAVRTSRWRQQQHAAIQNEYEKLNDYAQQKAEQLKQQTQTERLRQEQLRESQSKIIMKNNSLIEQTGRLEMQYNHRQMILIQQLESFKMAMRTPDDIEKDLQWKNYEQMCMTVDKHLNFLTNRLTNIYQLNEREIRLCVLVLLNMSRSEMSKLLNYSLSGMGKLKDTTAKKLGTTGAEMSDYLTKLIIEG